MLFANEQRRRIAAGEVTATIRLWTRPQAKAGAEYRFGEGSIAVESVERVRAGDLAVADAQRAGFGTVEEALRELAAYSGQPVDPGTDVFVVRFRYAAAPPTGKTLPVDTVMVRLERLDRDGPWTAGTLKLIGERPRIVSTELAKAAGMERFAFKANVRKLKGLGLTRSHDVGYELTELGREALQRLEQEAPGPG